MKHLILLLAAAALLLPHTLAAQERSEESEKQYLDFWENWLTPQQYAEQWEYVQNTMLDENQLDFKHRRREISGAQKWQGVGPSRVRTLLGDRSVNPDIVFHGRVRSLEWYNDPSAGWELYLGASSGGLWVGHASFFGRIWNSLGDNLPNPSVGAFKVKPGDPATIFAGTGDFLRFKGSGLYKTTNRGASWNSLPLMVGSSVMHPDYITDLFYDPTDASIMWLSSAGGVFKSVDSGATWNIRPVDPAFPYWPVHDMVIDPSSHNTVYVAFAYSQNGFGKIVWKTTNGGASWAPFNFGLPDDTLGISVALDISASNPSVLYAALTDKHSKLRGIYKTTNGGSVWNPTSAQPYDYMNGQGADKNVIRVHPTNPNIVYAGSIGFVKSTDGGASWTVPHRGHDDQTVIDFDPVDPTKMYVGGDGGIFRYDDAANFVRNVDEIFTPGGIIQSYSLDYAQSEPNVMISGTQDNGTLVTTKGGLVGADWTMFSGCDGGNEVAIDPASSSTFYFNSWCGGSHPRLRSLDQGGTVANINSGLADTIYYTPIGQCRDDPGYLFTVNVEDLYYSSDQGGSWQRATTDSYDFTLPAGTPRGIAVGGSGGNIVCYCWFWGSPWYVQVFEGVPGAMTGSTRDLPAFRSVGQANFANSGIRVDRWNPNTAYAFEDASPFRIFKTTNAGVKWTEITGTDAGGVLPAARKYDIASSPADPNIMYAGTDFGVFKTTNNGATWYKYQWGLPIVPVTSVAYIPGNPGGPDTLRIGTFGRGYWQRLLSGDDPLFLVRSSLPIHGLDFLGEFGLASGTDGRIAVSRDDGATWAEPHSPATSTLKSSRLLDSLRGIAVGLAGSIVRTGDGGLSWSVVPSPVASSFFDVFFTDPVNGFAVGDAGTIIRSTDSGKTWNAMMTGTNRTFHSITFSTPLDGWISGTDNTGQIPMILLLHTTDGGGTWAPTQSVGPGGGCDVMFPDPLTGYLTAEGGSMFKTTDGGQTWNGLQTGVQESLHEVYFANPDAGWACGDGGILLHTTNGGQQWLQEQSGSDTALYRIALSSAHLFTAGEEGVFGASTTVTTEVLHPLIAGWNLVSVPVLSSNYATTNVFPTASTAAFAYHAGYGAVNALEPGAGYWLKFDADATIGHVGPPSTLVSISVRQQWNIIGSLSTPVGVGSITSNPPGIVTSSFFGYNGGYQVANALDPGQGYWVKVSQDGVLYLSQANDRSMAGTRTGKDLLERSSRLTISDQRGHRQNLYFRSAAPADKECFDLPPLPPQGSFDVRFATGRDLEAAERESRDIPILVSSAVYPLGIAWEMREPMPQTVLAVNGREVALNGKGALSIDEPASSIRLHLAGSAAGSPIPETFALDQNYPNPFNPTTTVAYELPVESRVKVVIYDVMGQIVAALIDEVQPAGFRSAEWNASNAASGMYFCRLEATSLSDPGRAFTAGRKMLLLK